MKSSIDENFQPLGLLRIPRYKYPHIRIHHYPVHLTCEELLEKVRNGVVKGHINSTVIDEFFHKVLLMQVYAEKGLQPAEAIAFLKQNPERIADFPLPFDVTREVLHDYGIIVLDTAPFLDETLAFSKKYGLLLSDALHAAICTHYMLDHLITNDRDFSRVDRISVIAP